MDNIEEVKKILQDNWGDLAFNYMEDMDKALDFLNGVAQQICQLPEGEPPLLSDDGVRKALEKIVPEKILFYQSSYEKSSIAWNEFIAQAQRDSDIKWIRRL